MDAGLGIFEATFSVGSGSPGDADEYTWGGRCEAKRQTCLAGLDASRIGQGLQRIERGGRLAFGVCRL
jgi:hypothetical protein